MTFLKKIHIHPILILFIILSILTGTFIQLFLLFSIILIHELGHYAMANYFHWQIHSIVLWVFGGVMKTSETTNRPIREDVLVTLAGPIQHVWIFLIFWVCSYFQLLPDDLIRMGIYYNWIILVFNLLPIYPLDGGKLLFHILSSFISYKKAHQFTYKSSIAACFMLIIYQLINFPFTLSSLLLLVFLIWENRNEWKHHPYIFMRFLFTRSGAKKTDTLIIPGDYRLIDVFYMFRRNRYHYIGTDSHIKNIPESVAIAHYFEKQKPNDTVNDLLKII